MQRSFLIAGIVTIGLLMAYFLVFFDPSPTHYRDQRAAVVEASSATPALAASSDPRAVLDKAAYDRKLLALSGYGYQIGTIESMSTDASSTTFVASITIATTTRRTSRLWPAKTVYPNAGALLPFYRIVAYYGNFYSTQMGVLGSYAPDVVLAKLKAAAASWAVADASTPVIPAIDYIAVTAQGSAGPDGMYRLRMPHDQVEKALGMANSVHGELILDVQVGKSTLQQELPPLEQYLKLPNVHLAIDPEFSMKGKYPPGTIIGTYNSGDINYAANFLAKTVQENNLPPKILIVHRFTEDMVTGYRKIQPLPEVEIVMDMDGWGFPDKKIHTYKSVIASEPVQFTGFKLFYKADLRPPSTRMLTPKEVLSLKPHPIFIQYQ